MSSFGQDQRVAEWLDDQALSSEEAASSIHAALDADEHGNDEYHRQQATIGQLRARFVGAGQRTALTAGVMTRLLDLGPATSSTASPVVRATVTRRTLQRIHRHRGQRRWRLAASAAAVAALVLIGLVVGMPDSGHVPVPAPVTDTNTAVVTSAPVVTEVARVIAVSGLAPLPPVGTQLNFGSHIETQSSSSLALAYADGARLEVAGNSDVDYLSHSDGGGFWRLNAGMISVAWTREQLLEIRTQAARLTVDRRAEQPLSASIEANHGDTYVTVFSGIVECRELGSQEPLRVHAGQRAVVTAGRPPRLLTSALIAHDVEDGTPGLFVDAGDVVTPPAGNTSRWCLRAVVRPWTLDNRQVAVLDSKGQGLFTFDPELELSFDYWLSPGVSWADVWLGNVSDGSFQVLPLASDNQGSWQHITIRLDEFEIAATHQEAISRCAVRGERIASLGFQTSVAEGGELYIDNVRIGPPVFSPPLPEALNP